MASSWRRARLLHHGTLRLQIRPGLGRIKATYSPPPGAGGTLASGQAWLAASAHAWNTCSSAHRQDGVAGLFYRQVEGRWRLDGKLDLDSKPCRPRRPTLETLGSYRGTLTGRIERQQRDDAVADHDRSPLQLIGSGTWGPAGVKFRGEATLRGGRRGRALQLAQHHRSARRRPVDLSIG